VVLSGGVLAAVYHPNAPVFGPVVGRGPRRRELYLTFDDGPNPCATPRVLDALARAGVPAAFFLVGEHVRRFPDLARAVAAGGHELGNHTMHHRKLHVLGPGAVERELREAHHRIQAITGITPRYFRAPHGSRNPFVARSARRLGYRTIGWTFGVWDSDPIPAGEIRRRVRSRLRPGAIVLLHDGDGYDPAADRDPTAAAVEGIIQDARDAGYAFRRLGEIGA
jgi:peptidoglycan/xylan/chitin deacetylase (PgdA/CDA1 family)